MSKLKCLNCGSENLTYYREELYIFNTTLNKNGTIPKKEKLGYTDGNFPCHIDCVDCRAMFNYEVDKKGKVVQLTEL
ncbi:hypothetical protein D3C81_07860 [compost metagenome]